MLVFLAVILSEQENLMCKKKIELWFETSVEWNHFLARLKPLLPILVFVNCFDNISYLSRNRNTYFWMHPEMEWYLILSQIPKVKYSFKELVNFIFMLPVIFMFRGYYEIQKKCRMDNW